jgi:hypothetical protein
VPLRQFIGFVRDLTRREEGERRLHEMQSELDPDKPTPRNDEPAFDAANVLRFGRDLIYLVSSTGNEMRFSA